jgi:hypothetical protein
MANERQNEGEAASSTEIVLTQDKSNELEAAQVKDKIAGNLFNRIMKSNAVRMIYVISGGLFLIWLGDTVILNFNGKISSLSTEIFDFLKIIIPTLIGFAFSEKDN